MGQALYKKVHTVAFVLLIFPYTAQIMRVSMAC
jgi:hypothetical protein